MVESRKGLSLTKDLKTEWRMKMSGTGDSPEECLSTKRVVSVG